MAEFRSARRWGGRGADCRAQDLISGSRSCAEAVGEAAHFADVQCRELDNSLAVVKLVDQNGPLRG